MSAVNLISEEKIENMSKQSENDVFSLEGILQPVVYLFVTNKKARHYFQVPGFINSLKIFIVTS